MDASFESRVWRKALDRGWLTAGQIQSCLKEFHCSEPSLRLTEILVSRGHLAPAQVDEIRGEMAVQDPDAPGDVRAAARNPKNLIGRYVLVGELGRGGMGIVSKAWDADLRRYVALKVLAGPYGEEDLARFRREAESAAALRHPDIVTVYEIGPSDERPYIAMEFVQGRTLAGQRLPPREAASLMARIARAAQAAHRQGILHRDLKPSNVMIDEDGRPRLMDFGLARPMEDSSQITGSGTIMGTPAYMSPEQAQGLAREVDARSDVFSLGAMFYELLTGRRPFGGTTPLETMTAVVRCMPVPPRKLDPSIPRALEAVTLTCLRRERELRYASADAFAGDLDRFLAGEKVQARISPKPGKKALAAAGAALLAAAVAAFTVRRPLPGPLPLASPTMAVRPAAPADRHAFDEALRLLEETRLDLYRAQADTAATRATLEKALHRLGDALKTDPGWGEAHLARGQALERLRHFDEALAEYSEAIARMPTSPAAHLARGRLLLDRFMGEVASTSWAQAANYSDEATQWRDRATRDFIRARQLAGTGTEVDVDMPYLEACLALAGDQFDRVDDVVFRALTQASRPEEYHKLRGDARLVVAQRSGNLEKRSTALGAALEDYGRALALRPNYSEARRMRGAALSFAGRADESLQEFLTLTRMNPEDSQALSDLGVYYFRAAKWDLALDALDRAIASDPRNYRALSSRAALRLQAGRPADARRDAEQALGINPNYLSAEANLAHALYQIGDRAGAISHYSHLVERAPKVAGLRASRGRIYFEEARWSEALADFEEAAASDPAYAPKVQSWMEECRRKLGR